jgi:hypothetical protein
MRHENRLNIFRWATSITYSTSLWTAMALGQIDPIEFGALCSKCVALGGIAAG